MARASAERLVDAGGVSTNDGQKPLKRMLKHVLNYQPKEPVSGILLHEEYFSRILEFGTIVEAFNTLPCLHLQPKKDEGEILIIQKTKHNKSHHG